MALIRRAARAPSGSTVWGFANAASYGCAADGSLTWWVDGAKVASYASIQFVSGAGSWDLLKWDPTWGGLGGYVPADQTMQLDHLYLSGK